MAYENLSYRELQRIVKQRFYGKNIDRKNRGIKLNATKIALQNILRETDLNPPQSNRVIIQRRNTITTLRAGLIGENVVRDFNALDAMKYRFEESDIQNLFQNGGQKMVLEIYFEDGTMLNMTFLARNINLIKQLLRDRVYIDNNVEGGGSDQWVQHEGKDIRTFRLISLEGRPNVRRYLAFFPFLNETNIDLQKYQIYTKEQQTLLQKQENECCVLFAIKQIVDKDGVRVVSDEQINDLMYSIRNIESCVPLSKMPKIAESLKVRIVLHFYDENKMRVSQHKYGDKSYETIIELSQYKNHIFLFEPTQYSLFYINHLEAIENRELELGKPIKNKTLVNNMVGGGYYSKKPKHLNTLELVVNLHKNNKFSDYGVCIRPSSTFKLKPNLCNIEQNQRLLELPKNVIEPLITDTFEERKEKYSKPIDEEENIHLICDCESDVTLLKHKVMSFQVKYKNRYELITYKEQGGIELFKKELEDTIRSICFREGHLKKILNVKEQLVWNKKIYCWFLNTKYDNAVLQDLFYSSSEVIQDGTFYEKTYWIQGNIAIIFRDATKLFGMGTSLASCTKMFDLPISKKDAFNYQYHTRENINKLDDRVSVKKYLKGVKEAHKDNLIKNLRENKKEVEEGVAEFDYEFNEEKSTFNPNTYFKCYAKFDVDVLQLAIDKYRELMYQVSGLDGLAFMTISSLGHSLAKHQGCYEGLYEVKGQLRDYIQQSLRGGRVFVNPEFKGTEIVGKISDPDANSLYPSAMVQDANEGGLPIGKIKLGLEQTQAYYNSKDWYIIRILVKQIRKQQQVPSISLKNKKTNCLDYINALPDDKPTEFHVDKYTLEDWVRQHDIDYEILDGIYWDEGYNKRLGMLANHLFEQRRIYKTSNPSLANMFKLISNSIYGKTGQKSSTTKTTFVSNEKIQKFVWDNFGTIDTWETNKFNNKVVQRMFDDGYSLNYVASKILSMSKKIMNRVFDIMNDNNMKAYYTDTDSIHMDKKDEAKLNEIFKEKYNRHLFGKELGQMSSDFELEGAKNVASILFIPFGCKSYLDVLEGEDERGEKVLGTHFRLKGMNKTSTTHQITERMKTKNLNEIEATIDLFKSLINEEKVVFNMNPTKLDACFEFTKDGVRSRKLGWSRTINDDEL